MKRKWHLIVAYESVWNVRICPEEAHQVRRGGRPLADLLWDEEEVVDVAVLDAGGDVVDDRAGRRVVSGHVLPREDPQVDPFLDDDVRELRLVASWKETTAFAATAAA